VFRDPVKEKDNAEAQSPLKARREEEAE